MQALCVPADLVFVNRWLEVRFLSPAPHKLAEPVPRHRFIELRHLILYRLSCEPAVIRIDFLSGMLMSYAMHEQTID